MIGTTVSRYRIVAQLGSGGMGVVYEAEDVQLGRRVAVKFLPPGLIRDSAARQRFEREARTASALAHPHICVVHDFGEHEGRPFLIMERLRGQTLAQAIAGKPLPSERVVHLGAQIADALDAAHRAGIVHRDIKPGNLFLTERGEIKVLDFGLAKVVNAADGGAAADAPTVAGASLTEVGTTLGTVAYMSPEQTRGEALDARSDLFSVGVVLYEMSTGRLPFAGESTAETFAAILRAEPVPPSRLNAELPQRLDDIVRKALEKDVGLRYQFAAELRGDLKRLARDASLATAQEAPLGAAKPAPASRAGRSRRRGRWIAVGAAAAVGIAVVIATALLRRGVAPAPVDGTVPGVGAPGRVEHSIAVLPFVNMSSDPEQGYFAEGLSEELLNLLARVPALRVTSRTSAFALQGQNLEIAEIGRKLKVHHVLEGSVRKSGDRVRVTAQLIEVGSDTHLWSETWDRTIEDIFAVQDEIAAAVVAAMQVELLGAAPQSRRTAPEAFALYLRAEQAQEQGTGESLERAFALYQQALAIDPDYAAAWAGRATTALVQGSLKLRPTNEAVRSAREAANRAVELDPASAEGHASLGRIAMSFDDDLAAAARHLERALDLDASNAESYRVAAFLLLTLERPQEAVAFSQFSVARDPLNSAAHAVMGRVYHLADRPDDAISSFRTALAISPGRVRTQFQLGLALLAKGENQAALAAFEQEPSALWRQVGLPMAYHALGQEAASRQALETLIAAHGEEVPWDIARVFAFRDEVDRAFEWMHKAAAASDLRLQSASNRILAKSLARDPRWLLFWREHGRAPEQLAAIEFRAALPE